jgi:hypothetical protein
MLMGLPSLYGNHAACWAHARRKFHDIHLAHASPTTTEGLARIGALYAIEDEICGKPVDLRLSVRQARARPLLDDLRKWMEKALRSLSSKSETAVRFDMRSHAGELSPAIPKMDCSRSTTAPPNGRLELSLLGWSQHPDSGRRNAKTFLPVCGGSGHLALDNLVQGASARAIQCWIMPRHQHPRTSSNHSQNPSATD